MQFGKLRRPAGAKVTMRTGWKPVLPMINLKLVQCPRLDLSVRNMESPFPGALVFRLSGSEGTLRHTAGDDADLTTQL